MFIASSAFLLSMNVQAAGSLASSDSHESLTNTIPSCQESNQIPLPKGNTGFSLIKSVKRVLSSMFEKEEPKPSTLISKKAKVGFVGRLVQKGFYPRNLQNYYSNWNEREISAGKVVKIPTLDHVPGTNRPHLLNGIWTEGRQPQRSDDEKTLDVSNQATIILFHGNGDSAESMNRRGKFLQDLGINTLSVTYRGYPGSDGNLNVSSDTGLMLDGEAAVRYAVETLHIPKDKIAVYGLSLGGAVAAHTAEFFDLPLIVHDTFANPVEAAYNTVKNIHLPQWPKMTAALRGIPKIITKAAVRSAIKPGIKFYLPEGHFSGKEFIESNGLNSEAKVAKMNKKLFVIQSDNDFVMAPFKDRFLQAKYKLHPGESSEQWAERVAPYTTDTGREKGHAFPFDQNLRTREKLKAFLTEIHFLPADYSSETSVNLN